MALSIEYYVAIWTDAQVNIWDKYKVSKYKERLEGIKQMAKRDGIYEEVEAEAEKRLEKSIFNPDRPENIEKFLAEVKPVAEPDDPEDQAK